MRKKTRRRVSMGIAALAAVGIGTGVNAATAQAYSAYQLAPINGHAAFGIGPTGTQHECQQIADRLGKLGAKRYGTAFGQCVYDPSLGWLATSPWAQ